MLKKLIKKLSAKYRKKLTKTMIIDSFIMDGIEYRVIDNTSSLPFIKDRRMLAFKNNGRVYHHSAIYLNPKFHVQPIYNVLQELFLIWGEKNEVKNALVLGCAGCSIPRFISLHYPNSKTTGVEISEKFIEIAKKYFLLNEISNQFELIQADAIEYIKNNQSKEKQSIIYVDIFDSGKLIDDVFSDSFMSPLYTHTDESSLITFNFAGKQHSDIMQFAESINLSFYLAIASSGFS